MDDDETKCGSVFGVPYDFRRPRLGRLVSAHWKPGDGMLVRKPFGLGYTLNLANWRSWVALAVTGLLVWSERSGADGADADASREIVIED
jgi:hypothetical protein